MLRRFKEWLLKDELELLRSKDERIKEMEEQISELTHEKTEKEIATENNEPWVDIINVDLDENDIGVGAFELDWNDLFIIDLRRAGYQGEKDEDVVDMWLRHICRNIVTETFEKEQAMNADIFRYIQRENLGNGRTEVS